MDKSSSGKVDKNVESRISNDKSFIVEVMSKLKADRKSSNREELVKHIISEFTDKLANENKLIKKKFVKRKIRLVYLVPTIKVILTKRILTLRSLSEIIALKELLTRKVIIS